MEWTEILANIFELCIYPVIYAVAIYLVAYFKNKAAQLKEVTANEGVQASLAILNIAVENSVLATKQTYVEALKKEGNFNETAHKMAFKITYDAVMASLTEETKKNLSTAIKDLPKYVTDLIEAKVNETK